MNRYICTIIFVCWFTPVRGEEFSQPRDFSEFESNLGEQKLVEVVKPWIGVTPQELAPGSIPLGSLKNRTFVPAEVIHSEPEPLMPVERLRKKRRWNYRKNKTFLWNSVVSLCQ